MTRIPERVTGGIFVHPCVSGILKDSQEDMTYHVMLMDTLHLDGSPAVRAYPGDWLAEDYDGQWHRVLEVEHRVFFENDNEVVGDPRP